jgi:hypothetical protein
MHLTRQVMGLLGCTAVAGGMLSGLAATSVASSTTAEAPTAAQTTTLSAGEINMLDSGQPIDVVMDPTTGDILSVTAASANGVTAAISNHSVCNAGDGCYKTNQAPVADQGFFGGAGTVNGSWPDRSGYSSGKWTVAACWSSNCGVQIGPGSSVSFTSDVTGTSFTIVG